MLDTSTDWMVRAYGLDDPRAVGALAAEAGPGGLPAQREGARVAGVSLAWLIRLQRDLLRDRQKEHRHARAHHRDRGPPDRAGPHDAP